MFEIFKVTDCPDFLRAILISIDSQQIFNFSVIFYIQPCNEFMVIF